MDKGRSPFPPFVNISQTRTEELLDQQIARSALITYAWGHRVTGLRQDADHVTLTCETPSGTVDLTGSYAVAAPGSKGGPIRDLMGLTFDGLTFDDQFLICDIRASLPGWEMWPSSGYRIRNIGLAVSSVTRPPPCGSSPSGRR